MSDKRDRLVVWVFALRRSLVVRLVFGCLVLGLVFHAVAVVSS